MENLAVIRIGIVVPDAKAAYEKACKIFGLPKMLINVSNFTGN